MQISNDGLFSGTLVQPYTSRTPWQITQYGDYIIPRIVYVRWLDLSDNVLDTKSDDIILDVNAPIGGVSISGTTTSTAAWQPLAAVQVTLALTATDDVSGVGGMQVSNQPGFVAAIWQAFATRLAWTLGESGTVYVHFRDNAGNVSETYAASRRYVYLPAVLRQ
jgi:hypothetical protein